MDADGFFEVLRSRRSVRAFADRAPERAVLDGLFEATRWAPSNHNRQGWKFIVFQDKTQVGRLAERVRQSLTAKLAAANRLVAAEGPDLIHYATLFENAPVVILAMHKKGLAAGRELADGRGGSISSEAISAAMAVQNLLLAAHVLGLGACVMTAPLLADGVWEAIPDLPAGFVPTCVVAVGYPAEAPAAPRRKSLGHIVEYR
jgi:coenzyme F420-0:L-glutamate ligase / coenzyme F420-1:gamma-L-glutamate ligase